MLSHNTLVKDAFHIFFGHGGAHQPDEGLHLANFKKALLIFGMGILEADKALA